MKQFQNCNYVEINNKFIFSCINNWITIGVFVMIKMKLNLKKNQMKSIAHNEFASCLQKQTYASKSDFFI